MAGRPPKDITGKKSCGGYGKLTAIEPTNEKKNKEIVWLCKCDCGKFSKVRVGLFATINSCGCSRKGLIKNFKHGHTKAGWKSPTYISWEHMKYRITKPDKRTKKYYKDKTICESWMKFENFLENMGERPEGFELHRIDNSKGYYPNNCEWKEKSKHVADHNREWKG